MQQDELCWLEFERNEQLTPECNHEPDDQIAAIEQIGHLLAKWLRDQSGHEHNQVRSSTCNPPTSNEHAILQWKMTISNVGCCCSPLAHLWGCKQQFIADSAGIAMQLNQVWWMFASICLIGCRWPLFFPHSLIRYAPSLCHTDAVHSHSEMIEGNAQCMPVVPALCFFIFFPLCPSLLPIWRQLSHLVECLVGPHTPALR